jgi:hypothetical protein
MEMRNKSIPKESCIVIISSSFIIALAYAASIVCIIFALKA